MNTSNTSVHDSSKQQIKNFIDVVYEYFLRRNDKVFSQLQRQLQVCKIDMYLKISANQISASFISYQLATSKVLVVFDSNRYLSDYFNIWSALKI